MKDQIENTDTEATLTAKCATTEKNAGLTKPITLKLKKRECSLLIGLIKVAFEMKIKKEFNMNEQSIVKLLNVFEDLSEKVRTKKYDIMLTKEESNLLWQMISIAIGLALEGLFPMGKNTCAEILPIMDSLAAQIDRLNGVSQFDR